MITLTEKERKEALHEIAEHYGRENQLEMLVEECAELIQAVQKMKRYPDNLLKIGCFFEELADVQIMIDQIKLLVTSDDLRYFERAYCDKLNRQLKRMKEGD